MLTSFQKTQVQFVPIYFKFVIYASCCICGVIFTFYSYFERLFSCFTLFGGNSQFLNFDKFRYTAPLILRLSLQTVIVKNGRKCKGDWIFKVI